MKNLYDLDLQFPRETCLKIVLYVVWIQIYVAKSVKERIGINFVPANKDHCNMKLICQSNKNVNTYLIGWLALIAIAKCHNNSKIVVHSV